MRNVFMAARGRLARDSRPIEWLSSVGACASAVASPDRIHLQSRQTLAEVVGVFLQHHGPIAMTYEEHLDMGRVVVHGYGSLRSGTTGLLTWRMACKLLGTSASLVVTSALLVVTRSY